MSEENRIPSRKFPGAGLKNQQLSQLSGGSKPPLILGPNWGPKGGKFFFLRPPPSPRLFSGYGWSPPSLCEGLDPPHAYIHCWSITSEFVCVLHWTTNIWEHSITQIFTNRISTMSMIIAPMPIITPRHINAPATADSPSSFSVRASIAEGSGDW